MKNTVRLLLALAVMSLYACGGSGSGDSSSTAPPVADSRLSWDNGNWDETDWQ